MTGPRGRARRVYEGLLHLYPRSFRARFGDGMQESFENDLETVRLHGRAAAPGFLALTLVDVIRFGLAERLRPAASNLASERRKGTTMRSLLSTDSRDADPTVVLRQ